MTTSKTKKSKGVGRPEGRTPSSRSVIVTWQITEDTHFKLSLWQEHLEDLWDRRVTRAETLDFIADTMGPPPGTE